MTTSHTPEEKGWIAHIRQHLSAVEGSPDWADLDEILGWYKQDVADLLADATARAQEVVTLKRQLEEHRKDVLYHADCRPNRRQAEAAMADAKAMNDKWADEVVKVRDLEARCAVLTQELDVWKANYVECSDMLAALRAPLAK